MDQVITHDKTYEERLQEYTDLLSGNGALPVSHIKNIWSFYLELALDPEGWHAVWKIPRATCKHLTIPFPSLVLVYVYDLNLKDLTAYVRIVAVQDDITIPETYTVPLKHLYPTKDQERGIGLNIESTSYALDMLRFFYSNLIFPWDYDEDDTNDWVSRHLESRLRLYYDMKNGVIPRTIAEHVRALIMEACRLESRRDELEFNSERDNIEDRSVVEELAEVHVRIVQIKGEIEILENPLMRYVVLKEHKEGLPKREEGTAPIHWLLQEPSTADGYLEFLRQVKRIFPDEKLNFAKDLASTLTTVENQDVIILNRSKYNLKTVGKLENGGKIRGVYTPEDTVITSEASDVIFDVSSDVLLENLTINAEKSQFAILVRLGKVTLRNCKLQGKYQGVIVLDGCELVVDDCKMTGFSTAIVGNSGSKIAMNGVEIHHVDFGVKLYDGCTLRVDKSTFRNCREYGFCVESDRVASGTSGSFDLLKMMPDINVGNLSSDNNGKGDVAINRTKKIQPLKDLFSTFNEDEMDLDVRTNHQLDHTFIEDK